MTPENPDDSENPEAPENPGRSENPERSEKAEETDWQRRRRLAAVFGDVLPETTSDERDQPDSSGDASEEWLKRQVPPHHG